MYIFTNLIGSFVLDKSLKVIDQVKFNTIEDYENKTKTEEKLVKKHKAEPLPEDKLNKVLEIFKAKEYHKDFYTKNLQLTKQSIKDSVNNDSLITQTIANINELDRVNNILAKRLREWYSLYYPEFSEHVTNQEAFVEMIINKDRTALMTELKQTKTMGADLSETDIQEITALAQQIHNIFQLRKQHEQYLEKIMKTYCPNLQSLAGTTIGARLLELGKTLKHLALLPASTIQLLGAEKALFRHIKTGARSPKYGVIHAHPLVQKAKRDMKGKAARMLADKLSLCARLDYFKGEFKAEEYRKELEKKLQ